jgi:hypothetical protein
VCNAYGDLRDSTCIMLASKGGQRPCPCLRGAPSTIPIITKSIIIDPCAVDNYDGIIRCAINARVGQQIS